MERARIIICDDDEVLLKMHRRILEQAGHHATMMTDGAEVLAALGRIACDIIVTDGNMKVVHGWDLLRRLRDAENMIPVILVSADAADPNCLQKFEKMGFAAILPKPCKSADLVAAVQQALESLEPPEEDTSWRRSL